MRPRCFSTNQFEGLDIEDALPDAQPFRAASRSYNSCAGDAAVHSFASRGVRKNATVRSSSLLELQGTIDKSSDQKYAVKCLLDSGATHNFVSRSLVSRCGLPVTKNASLDVFLADGSLVKVDQVCVLPVEFAANFKVDIRCFVVD